MAGLYLHIPFCKQKCSYCDFHFSTSLKHKDKLLNAMGKEIVDRKSELNEPIDTIYFGGGTPSILAESELNALVGLIHANYKVSPEVEFTLECNPDDLSVSTLTALKQVGVNRLSIGVQSFRNEDLILFNRSHNATQAEQCIVEAQDIGITNLTLDLIYGSPSLDLKAWEDNLSKVAQLNVPHLSAYALTVEPKTALHHQVSSAQLSMPQDEKVIEQFRLLRDKTKAMGMDHYEISNFGKRGFYALHNSNYWKGVPYLGFGPSAHSFTGQKRRWNVANNISYVNAIEQNKTFFEQEHIDEITAYNEYVLTGLRTIWGIEKETIKARFGAEVNAHFERELDKLRKTSYLQIEKNKITLTEEGMTVADGIASDLFYLE